MIYKDQLNREINLIETPTQIVSLVPSLTELLVDLGLESLIIGVTKFCIHPEHLRKEKTVVGATKSIHIKKIKALKPDIILCNKEENSLEIVESLEGIAPVHISDIYNLDDAFELIKMYGELFQVEVKSEALISKIKSERKQFKLKTKNQSKRKVAYFIWRKPWMVAGSNTFIDAMLSEANYTNVFSGLQRYPEIDLDDENFQKAEIIFLSSEPYPFKKRHINELRTKFLDKKIILVNGELFSWYGSRLKLAFKYFKTLNF